MSGRHTKPLRRVKPDELDALVRRHEERGTCPSCGALVETFTTLILPNEEDFGIGCPHCSELAGAVIEGMRRVNAWHNMRN